MLVPQHTAAALCALAALSIATKPRAEQAVLWTQADSRSVFALPVSSRDTTQDDDNAPSPNGSDDSQSDEARPSPWASAASDAARPIALQYHQQFDELFWIAGSGIFRADEQSPLPTRLQLDGIQLPTSLALDESADAVFWTDAETKTIHRANLDGSGAIELLNLGEEAGKPSSLVLHPSAGLMFWIEPGKIRRAKVSGADPKDLVIDAASEPTSLAIDPEGDKLYWADASSDTLWRANLDGTAAEALLPLGDDRANPEHLALDAPHGWLYWTEGDELRRAALDSPSPETLLTLPEGGANSLIYKPCSDTDGDGVDECADNCPDVANPNQIDADFDGSGDACDAVFDLQTAVPHLVGDLDGSVKVLIASELSKTLGTGPQTAERRALVQQLVFGVRNPTLVSLGLLGSGVIDPDRFQKRMREVERQFSAYKRQLSRLINLRRFPTRDVEQLQNLTDSLDFQIRRLRLELPKK